MDLSTKYQLYHQETKMKVPLSHLAGPWNHLAA
jgi:hypothetical protein